MRGGLIVFEGVEGAGKTTQMERLADRLDRARVACSALREPGGTPLGDEIRRLLLDPNTSVAPWSEAFLFLASRAQLVGSVLKPALATGAVVLLDRFVLSTYAYQVAGRGLPEATVRAATRAAMQELRPDVTLLLTLPPTVGIQRAHQRSVWDRIERAGVEFHERVGGAFAAFAKPGWQRKHPECGPIDVIDATGTVLEVEQRILATLRKRLPHVARRLGKVA